MSDILDSVLDPRISPLRQFEAGSNPLTKVPSQLARFPLLNYIDLNQNAITFVPSNAFNFSLATLNFLNLRLNPINLIQDGAFQGS